MKDTSIIIENTFLTYTCILLKDHLSRLDKMVYPYFGGLYLSSFITLERGTRWSH